MFSLISYPSPSQKKFQDAYENGGVKREKELFFLNSTSKIKMFYTQIFIYDNNRDIYKP